VSPKDFKEAVDTDVYMVDQIGRHHNPDRETGEETGPESDPNLMGMVAGCIWNGQYATLIKKGAKGCDPNTLIMDQWEMAVKLIPDGKGMRYDTLSDWLVEHIIIIIHLLGLAPAGYLASPDNGA
jgi:hypothetical protein